MKIIDASVICKWYIPEDGTPEALALLEDFTCKVERFAAPDLALYELASALRHNKNISFAKVASALENFVSLGIEIVAPNVALIKKAAQLAFTYNITIYDAVYAALAESLGCDFITADKKLHKKLSSLSFVKML
ncbi:MAG: VapC toxin family PIN domain ribonuclease [Elusimicrobia bacterium CG08_land_8_20_14_0_20_59_10]|nr:MAG: VapC toxin family PIN domain ribonuclease [Elusimicrobia bacterium CG08_land_8_20_14_0_20_59_10]